MRTTWHEYTKHDLENGNVPKFDIYMTGSDQVWNCKYTRGDSNFLLKFAPENAPRLSYGSSFASQRIPKKYEHIFEEELVKYDTILVRENSGVNIESQLVRKKLKSFAIRHCCLLMRNTMFWSGYWTIGISMAYRKCLFRYNDIFSWDLFCYHISQASSCGCSKCRG